MFLLSKAIRHLHIFYNAPYLYSKILHTFVFHFCWVLQPPKEKQCLCKIWRGQENEFSFSCFVIPGDRGRVPVLRESEANARHFSPRSCVIAWSTGRFMSFMAVFFGRFIGFHVNPFLSKNIKFTPLERKPWTTQERRNTHFK